MPIRPAHFAFVAVVLARFAAAMPAGAMSPRSPLETYSPYEQEAIRDAERLLGTTVDAAPNGKQLDGIDIITLDVIEPRDPAPYALNRLHTTTRRDVILREVLLRTGDRYRTSLADETARNLRLLPQLSLVICIAMRGSTGDRVRLVVITKDVWSLLPDFDLVYNGGLTTLLLEPKETNFLGTHQTVLGRLLLHPESYALGAGYHVPRVLGRWLSFFADGNVVINRERGDPEGSFGSIGVERPLYSAGTAWSYGTGASWSTEVTRHYTGARVATFDDGVTPAEERVPFVYLSRESHLDASVTRSFGWEVKDDLSLHGGMSRYVYRPPPDLAGHDARAAARFVTKGIPVGETRVGPAVEWHHYETDFVRILDFETLGLQEDYRTGIEFVVRAYPVLALLGSSRDVLGAYGALQYTAPLGDGFARASIESTTELASRQISDGSLQANVRVVTPRLGIGRIVYDALVLNRYENYLNALSFLGGEWRLRGYPSEFVYGKDLLLSTLEYRSRPVEIADLQFGAAVFYDVGDAFDGFGNLHAKHTVGFGVRTVLPQIERSALRFDVGFPVTPGPLPPGVSPFALSVTFGQAFGAEGIAALPSAGSAPYVEE